VFVYKLLEEDNNNKNYLKISQLNEEIGKNVKDYLLQKNNL
jgi:hypothetical protein